MSQDWRKDPVPFPPYLLTNNNANIRRVRQRIEELGHKTEFVGWTFPGGEAKVNEAENRLQLIFEDKPDADTRQALKSEGIILLRPRPMSHGLAMMTRTASGSMNGGITATIWPPWKRTFQTG